MRLPPLPLGNCPTARELSAGKGGLTLLLHFLLPNIILLLLIMPAGLSLNPSPPWMLSPFKPLVSDPAPPHQSPLFPSSFQQRGIWL